MVHIVDIDKTAGVEEDRGAAGAQSIGRALGVLRLVAGYPSSGAALADLVETSGLVKPTCRRILLALMDAGFVDQDPITRRYFLGPEAYIVGTVAAERHGIHRLASEGVIRLARETGDAAFLQVRRGLSVVCLRREDGDYPIRSHVLAAGDRQPLGAGAGPLAILAALPDAEVEEALAANRAVLAQRFPVLTPDVLRVLVAETRAQGYSMNRGLLFPGSWGMGMAVYDCRGRVEACLSLAAVENRMQTDREPRLAALLAEEVRRLEQKLHEFKAATDDRPARRPAAPPATITRRKETA